MTTDELINISEAIIFASGEPVKRERIISATQCTEDQLDDALTVLQYRYASSASGIRLVFVEDTVAMHSAMEYSDYVRSALEMTKEPSLSLPSLEVLAIVAANQPVTRAYIDQIRGVDSTYTVSSLAEKGFIEDAGRLDVPGRPILYRTSAQFLQVFGVRDINELLSIPEISALRPENTEQDNGTAIEHDENPLALEQ